MPPLANFQQAVIEEEKLVRYALSPHSERGQHKAWVFDSILGFNLSNWRMLKQCILDALAAQQATFISETDFGRKYEVVLPITGPNGRTADILTIWQYDRLLGKAGYGTIPRLVTLYLS